MVPPEKARPGSFQLCMTSSASGPGALPPTISVRPSGMRTFNMPCGSAIAADSTMRALAGRPAAIF